MMFVYDFVVLFLCMCNMYSLPKLYASHLLILAVRVVVVLGWRTYCLPHPPGFKAQSMAGKIPAVRGWLSGIFFGPPPLLKGVVLLPGGDLLVVCSRWYVAPSFAALPNFAISSHQVDMYQMNMSQDTTAPSMKVCLVATEATQELKL